MIRIDRNRPIVKLHNFLSRAGGGRAPMKPGNPAEWWKVLIATGFT